MGVKPSRERWLANNKKVQPPVVNKDTGPEVKPVVAADLLKSSHPLNKSFTTWCVEKGTEVSHRQAVKFLRAFPAYRSANSA